jgi:hypothetical protein
MRARMFIRFGKPAIEPFVSRIVSIDVEHGSFTVGEPTVEGGIFIAGGFVLHNKPIEPEIG